MNFNSYEYVLMWASGCSEMHEHPILVLEDEDFEKVNTLAYKFRFLESEGYIKCNWELYENNNRALKNCSITPKGIDYYREIISRKPLNLIWKKTGTLLYGAIAACLGAAIAFWFKG